MLARDGHAAINRGLCDIDGARRQANGAAHRATTNRKRIAGGDDIAVDGGVVQIEALACPVQIAFDAGRIGVTVGRKNIARGIRAGKSCGGKDGKCQRDKGECDKEATPCFMTVRRRELIARHGRSFVRCSTCT